MSGIASLAKDIAIHIVLIFSSLIAYTVWYLQMQFSVLNYLGIFIFTVIVSVILAAVEYWLD